MSDYNPNYVEVKSYALVGQKAILTNAENKILLLHRSDKMGPEMKWSLPGGAIERGEDPLGAMLREIAEETQMEVQDVRPFTSRSYFSNQDDFVIIIGYVGKAISENPTLDWEHTEYKWVTKAEALGMDLTHDARFFIENIKS